MPNDDPALHGPKEEPVFDHSSALTMLANDTDLLREVLDLFLAEAPEQTKALGQAIESGDPVETERLAHGLKGAAINVHALRIRQKAAEIEASAQAQEMNHVAQQFEALQEELTTFQAHIRDIDWDDPAERRA